MIFRCIQSKLFSSSFCNRLIEVLDLWGLQVLEFEWEQEKENKKGADRQVMCKYQVIPTQSWSSIRGADVHVLSVDFWNQEYDFIDNISALVQ